MALSGSFDFTVNRNEMIRAAMRLIGVGRTGETPSAEEMEDASEALNLMLKAWHGHGLQLWKRETYELTLTAAKASYTFGASGDITTIARPLRILECNRKDTNGITVPLWRMSQKEYYAQPNRTQQGIPNSFFFDPTLTNSTLYFWQTPSTTAAANYTVEFVYHEPFNDLDGATDDFDCPAEWLEAIKYGLALRLAPEYDVPSAQRREIRLDAREMLEIAKDWDQGDESIFIEPAMDGRRDN